MSSMNIGAETPHTKGSTAETGDYFPYPPVGTQAEYAAYCHCLWRAITVFNIKAVVCHGFFHFYFLRRNPI